MGKGFYDDIERMIVNQHEIDDFYTEKKKEVGTWILSFAEDQKRLSEVQRKRLMWYAYNISFSNAKMANDQVQRMGTIGKRQKARFQDYIQGVDWLPPDTRFGKLDGVLVSRIPSDPTEELIRAAFGKQEENDGRSNDGETKKGIPE